MNGNMLCEKKKVHPSWVMKKVPQTLIIYQKMGKWNGHLYNKARGGHIIFPSSTAMHLQLERPGTLVLSLRGAHQLHKGIRTSCCVLATLH